MKNCVTGVKLGVIDCQSIMAKLEVVLDYIKEYHSNIVALPVTWWLSHNESKKKHIPDQCVVHRCLLHHTPRNSDLSSTRFNFIMYNDHTTLSSIYGNYNNANGTHTNITTIQNNINREHDLINDWLNKITF